METIFVNHCTYTYSKYLELKKTLLKDILRTGYVICAICLVILCVGLYFKQGFSMAIGVVGLVFFGYRAFVSPVLLAKADARRDKKTYSGNEMQTIINFYEDHLLAVNALSGSKTKIKYDDIYYIKKSKSMFIIGMDQNLVLLVDKNGFEKGSAEEFQKFVDDNFDNSEV